MSELQTLDKAYVANTYNRFPVEVVSGKGSQVYDTNGTRYIDMGSGIAVNSFGIADEAWMQAVTEQLGKVQHMSNLYYTQPCARLAELLCTRTGMKKVFFCNSGAEANECAIKVARKYAAEKKGAEYSTIVTLENSFHGRTLTTLAATGQAHYHELFQPLTPGFVHAPAGDIDALCEIVRTHKVAGILMECIQGEGGVNVIDADYIRSVASLCEKEDILLMIDEVQTGNGRTGELYAYMNYGIAPDVVSTAKGLAGGLPLGATLLSEKVENILGAGMHGSTFGGNPVCAAAAINVFSRLDEELLKSVKEKSAYIFNELKGAQGVVSVSGLGLMIGIETTRPAGEIIEECRENGVLVIKAKNKIRLLPALNIEQALLEKAVKIIKEACAK